MVLYQKIFITEVIPTLKLLLLFLPIFLFSANEALLELEEPTDVDDNISLIQNIDINETVETQESFLSSVEYGEMLYSNPRGISCSKCHGEKGKGGHKIAKYYDKEKNPKILKGVDIRDYSLEDLIASLKNQYRENGRRKRHKIMPIYYLTDDEVEAIYNYLQHNR